MQPGQSRDPAGVHAPGASSGSADDNAAMIAVWDGEVGRFWADETDRYERMNAGFGERLIQAAAPRGGERFLDIGCGHGGRTLEIAQLVGESGFVMGVDISGPMLEVAERRAHSRSLPQIRFGRQDAQTQDLGAGAYDGIVSQFGVMFFADPGMAFSNLQRALCNGGRLAFTCWQELGRQERIMVPVAAALEHVPLPDFDVSSWSHAAFSLADPEHIRALLQAAGFDEISIQEMVLPEYQGQNVPDVVSFMQRTELGQILFSRADPRQATQGWESVATAMAAYASADGVHLNGAAWLVQARKATT